MAEPVVKALSENHQYPVRYVSTAGYEDVIVKNVTAVNGNYAIPATVYVDGNDEVGAIGTYQITVRISS